MILHDVSNRRTRVPGGAHQRPAGRLVQACGAASRKAFRILPAESNFRAACPIIVAPTVHETRLPVTPIIPISRSDGIVVVPPFWMPLGCENFRRRHSVKSAGVERTILPGVSSCRVALSQDDQGRPAVLRSDLSCRLRSRIPGTFPTGGLAGPRSTGPAAVTPSGTRSASVILDLPPAGEIEYSGLGRFRFARAGLRSAPDITGDAPESRRRQDTVPAETSSSHDESASECRPLPKAASRLRPPAAKRRKHAPP